MTQQFQLSQVPIIWNRNSTTVFLLYWWLILKSVSKVPLNCWHELESKILVVVHFDFVGKVSDQKSTFTHQSKNSVRVKFTCYFILLRSWLITLQITSSREKQTEKKGKYGAPFLQPPKMEKRVENGIK